MRLLLRRRWPPGVMGSISISWVGWKLLVAEEASACAGELERPVIAGKEVANRSAVMDVAWSEEAGPGVDRSALNIKSAL
jgi:hypothetical protein